MALRALFFSMCRVKCFSLLLFSIRLSLFFLTSRATQQKATDAKRQSNLPLHPPPPPPLPAIFSLWHSSHYLWDLVKPNLHVFVRPLVRFFFWLLCLSVVRLWGIGGAGVTSSVQPDGDSWRGSTMPSSWILLMMVNMLSWNVQPCLFLLLQEN